MRRAGTTWLLAVVLACSSDLSPDQRGGGALTIDGRMIVYSLEADAFDYVVITDVMDAQHNVHCKLGYFRSQHQAVTHAGNVLAISCDPLSFVIQAREFDPDEGRVFYVPVEGRTSPLQIAVSTRLEGRSVEEALREIVSNPRVLRGIETYPDGEVYPEEIRYQWVGDFGDPVEERGWGPYRFESRR